MAEFLNYDPVANEYYYAPYQVALEQAQERIAPGTTIKDRLKAGGGSFETQQQFTGQGVKGSIYNAEAGFNAFTGAVDALSMAPVAPLAAALGGYEAYTGFKSGMNRAETFANAAAADATVSSKLAAYQQSPTIGQMLSTGLKVATALMTPLGFGTIGAGLALASTISAKSDAEKALEEAGQMERLAYATGQNPASFTGYQQELSNFMSQPQAETNIVSLSPSQTIGDILGGSTYRTTDSSGRVTQTTSFSDGGSMSQDISANRETASRREAEGYQGSSFGDRRGTTGRDGGSSSGGFSGQSASSDKARFGIDVGGGGGGDVAGRDW